MTKEKSTVPRLRFPGFTTTWKQRKLGEEISFYNGRAYKQSELLDVGKYKVVRVGNFNTNEKWYYSNLELEDSKTIDTGDLIYLWATSFGPEIWKGAKSIYHYHIWKLIIKQVEKIDKNYLYTWLYQDKEKIAQNTNGSTMVHITKKMIENRDFEFPTLPEQEAIGSFFSDLDQLITLHQRKLDDVKELKKALLQKMFPKGNGNDFPELRFPEFTDAWKQRKLGEVADFSIKTNSLSRDKLSSYFYEVQNIHYGDILTKYDAILDVCNKELPSIIGSTISDFVDALLIEGDIVFADAAEDSTVGKAVEVRNFKGKNVVSGLHTIVARPKVSYAPYYLGYLINSTAYHNQILPLMQGTKVSSISKANLKSTTVVFPTLPEQEVIGSFFSDLDQLITLHQRQLDHLKLLKKALLQQMFI
ncbi:TPA: restriction endonuclease subunit S [Streptococcus suis]|uniref:restriction endonuclease subunit S n=1 Tax=Streptococcus suis TaxID=1307 RepID=UPI000CF58E47|nr:restriction endonuclease subunit S [Streptococcus suis]MCQ9286270.1 restriction endonuclease subunit S [Streptococcus suis]HEM6057693.1 restriction endonuclease subunit S [Streptococcus suis]